MLGNNAMSTAGSRVQQNPGLLHQKEKHLAEVARQKSFTNLSSSRKSLLQTLKSSESKMSSVFSLTSAPERDASALSACLACMCMSRF